MARASTTEFGRLILGQSSDDKPEEPRQRTAGGKNLLLLLVCYDAKVLVCYAAKESWVK